MIAIEGASHRSENWWPNQWGYKREMVTWLGTLPGGRPRSHTPFASTTLLKNVVYGDRPEMKLDAFVTRSGKPRPAVIVVHGGGWEAGDKVTYVTPLFEPLARAGLSWFSIDYRLTPAFTNQDQLADVRQAIRFVRTGHARFNIDPARIVLIGESASGQMVAQIATEDSSLAGVVSFYGVYDLPAMVTDASPRSLLVRLFRRHTLDEDSRSLLRRFSPLYQAHAGHAAPPADQRHRRAAVGAGAGFQPTPARARRASRGDRARRRAAWARELGRARGVDDLQGADGGVDSVSSPVSREPRRRILSDPEPSSEESPLTRGPIASP